MNQQVALKIIIVAVFAVDKQNGMLKIIRNDGPVL
jgi:hypothetical protein